MLRTRIRIKNGKRELQNSDIYFLDKMMHRVGTQLIGIPLLIIIICYMRTTAQMRPDYSCFGFPSLVSLLLEKLQVNVGIDKAMLTKPIDEITVTLLKLLAIAMDFGVSLVRDGTTGEASTSTHHPPHPQPDPRAQEPVAQ